MRLPLTRILVVVGLLLFVAGCAREEVRIGAKNFTENRILAEMFVALARDADIRVVRIPPSEDRGVALASMRAGSLDVYADYVATLLGRMGSDTLLERELARQQVTEALAEVGITALPPLGFDDGYVIAANEAFARRYDLNTLSDLVKLPDRPRIGTNRGFARLPNRGLEELLGTLGLQGAEVISRDNTRRSELYDMLLDQTLDLVVGFRTDPQLDQYPLRLLGPGEGSAPNYDALPLVRTAAAEATPKLVPTLRALSGRLTTAMMRKLVARVELDGQSPRNVARAALVELGLIEAAIYPEASSLKIALDGAEIDEIATVRLMRAIRRALPRRTIRTLPTVNPLDAVLERQARTALVPAVLLFGAMSDPAIVDPRFESIAAVGRSVVHLLHTGQHPPDVSDTLTIATGPEGSASHHLLEMIRPWLPEQVSSVALPAGDAITAADTLEQGAADLALVVAPLGRSDLETVLSNGRLQLASAKHWLTPQALLALPFLRRTVIASARYASNQPAVESVAMQRVLVGPSPIERRRVLGRGGPSTYSEELFPLPDHVVLALNAALGTGSDIAPLLAPAGVLQPRPLPIRAPLNPSPGQTVLSTAIALYLAWCVYLLLRPRRHA